MNSTTRVIVALGLSVGIVYLGIRYNGSSDKKAAEEKKQQQVAAMEAQQKIMDKLITEDTVVGTGQEAKAGDTVIVNYTGTFDDGKKFDSSYDYGQTFSFPLGAGRVIQGWDLGIPGMKVGGTRQLTIPSELAYGPQGYGSIPPNATLHFKVELVGIEKPTQ